MHAQVRRYLPTDHAAVVELHMRALQREGAWNPGPWDSDLADIEGNYLEEGEFLVVWQGEVLAAMGGLRKIDDETGEIKRMRVNKAFRRRGLGQELLDRLTDRAIELGFSTLRLDTTARQEAAQALYLKNGFVEYARKQVGPWVMVFFEKRLGRA